jgi:hypothetical protein
MRFTVTGDPSAQDKLAQIWMDALDRAAVTAAANSIDTSLRMSPDLLGYNLGPFRMLTVAPLTVTFEFSADDYRVTVMDVWCEP